MDKLLLLDSYSLLHRAFYAMPLNMTDTKGRFINAVFGFANMLFKLIAEEKPTHIAAAFDLKEKTFRHSQFDYYKATRKPMPEELRPQVDLVKDLLNAMGINIVAMKGFEADDIIGTLSKKFESKADVRIITGDRDSLQLISNNTHVLLTKKGITDMIDYTPERLLEEGLLPKQIIELKALMGDSSDNIKGVEGVGEVTAKKLLAQYSSVEGVYENIDFIKGKLHDKLVNGKDLAYESKFLATIVRDVPVDIDYIDLKFDNAYKTKLKNLLKEYGFNSIIQRLDFDDDEEVVTSKLETVFLNDLTMDIAGKNCAVVIDDTVHFAIDDRIEYVITLKEGLLDEGVTFDEALNYIKNNANYYILYDAKSQIDIFPLNKNNLFDAYLAEYVINPGRNIEKLSSILPGYGLDEKTPAVSLYALYLKQSEYLKTNGLYKLYSDLELPLIFVLHDMEKAGVSVDIEVLKDFKQSFETELHDVTEDIYEMVGERFNINSTKQLSHILYDKLGLKVLKKTKTGVSSSAEVLEALEGEHPVIALILRFRRLSKLLSTYIDGLYPLVDKATSKVHTVFMQGVTATGRLSSKEPNMQNIPVRDPEGMLLRKMFVASKDSILVCADYSQIELRLLAHFSEDPILIKAYQDGEDIHSATAAAMYGVEISDVDKQMRTSAKAVNFGIIYGISDYGLSESLKISVPEAKRFIHKYFETYPSIKSYMDDCVTHARENGSAVTLLGRIRRIPEIKSSNYNLRSFGERVAMNMPLQGTAADIIKMAMIRVYDRINREGLKAKLILQVHDELIVDSPIEELNAVKSILKEEMEGVVLLRVPLVADVSQGVCWYEAK